MGFLRRHARRAAPFAAACAVMALAGCAPAAAPHSPFTATGEVIAMGGGPAGATRACFTCHGLGGEGDGAFSPRLAALPVGYLQKQLEDYATGRRPDPVMGPIAEALSAADRAAVAAYYAGLPAAADGATRAPDPRGEALFRRPRAGQAACAACHGEDGAGVGLGNPPIAGQPEAYVVEQLRRWRKGERRNDPLGLMAAASRGLTDEQMRTLAGYVAALPPRTAPADAPPAASP
ncbi:c-type cytochrome [Phenylobacterium sp.]|uniref:c-type cytochrome n=1 Tax=Phenylobacterium sp. TaxID=1871053 RepID=UPI002FE2DF08